MFVRYAPPIILDVRYHDKITHTVIIHELLKFDYIVLSCRFYGLWFASHNESNSTES